MFVCGCMIYLLWSEFLKDFFEAGIVANGADKGSALKKIQGMFGISREETAAFGDNENDIGMLELAGQSYAVENARRAVRDAASHVIGPMREDAVLKVIKSWL